ncbi:unnamed protein product [Brassicogethes aeneus]|uniref:Uncharacterized protein n=1 Tax=Brassicogethes aeneus TaxID=1431903 RepID=A0A9P0BHS0_BRAAE|nr:unnamed protein product [Brassicogethes aeneus]
MQVSRRYTDLYSEEFVCNLSDSVNLNIDLVIDNIKEYFNFEVKELRHHIEYSIVHLNNNINNAASNISQDNVAEAHNINKAEYSHSLEVSGVTPLELNEHSQKATYQMIGMTPKDFITDHGAIELDFKALQERFKLYCQDYMEEITLNTKSLAVDFCAKVVYYVGPESRSVKKTTGDKYWRFKFPFTKDGLTDRSKISKVVFVATYKSEKTDVKDTTEKNKLILTVKQASLLAMDTFDKLAVIAYNMSIPKSLFTPLAGAIFSKNDLWSMSKELSSYFKKTYTESEVLTMINNSCQSNGHHLGNSNAAIALVSACVATRNIKDDKVKFSIISKIGKQYVKKGKNFNEFTFDIFSKYATGGVPSNMEPKKLLARLEEVQISTRQAAIASKNTALSSTIEVPVIWKKPLGASDCYFCTTNVETAGRTHKDKTSYSSVSSVQQPVANLIKGSEDDTSQDSLTSGFDTMEVDVDPENEAVNDEESVNLWLSVNILKKRKICFIALM